MEDHKGRSCGRLYTRAAWYAPVAPYALALSILSIMSTLSALLSLLLCWPLSVLSTSRVKT